MGDASLAMRGWPGRASLTIFHAGIFVLGTMSISCLELGLQRNFQVSHLFYLEGGGEKGRRGLRRLGRGRSLW